MNQPIARNQAQALDAQDELAPFRDRFVFDDADLIYLDGNSLGRLPTASMHLSNQLVRQEWGTRLIRGWNDGWMDAPRRIGAKIAQLVGAKEDEVLISDSTSVNLFKLLIAALQLQSGRTRIITDNLNFPSDLYVLQGVAKLTGSEHTIHVIESSDGVHGPEEAVTAACNERTAVVTLSHTAFKSGYVYDMDRITSVAQASGAVLLWDLSHSVGSVPVDLNAADVDLAVGCTYKYLNGGPGSPAFVYVRRDLQEKLENPISAWMGRENLFDFGLDYIPAPGLRRFLTGTPPVVSLALIEPGVDAILEAGIQRLRSKSVDQATFLLQLWQDRLRPLGYRLNSPSTANRRGSHISFGHDEGLGIVLALINDKNVIPDFRQPDNIRLGIAPLYTTYTELFDAVEAMATIVEDRLFEKYRESRPVVT